MSEQVIQTTGLTRYFGDRCAVDQVSLAVPRSSVFALLGRNGSGKTTLVRMLLGLLAPTRGGATILGDDYRKILPSTRGRIGYVGEGHPVIPWMSVRELAKFQRGFYPKWDEGLFTKIAGHFDLGPGQHAGKLSRGQRAGLSLALVLAGKPELLVLDDPAMGLDPVARRALLEAMILATRNAGNTIFFTSHLLDDVERVADHIAILDRSILRVCCPVETLRSRVKRLSISFAQAPPIPKLPGLLGSRREGNELQLTLANANGQIEKLIEEMGAAGVREVPMSLEEIVLAYLGGGAERSSLLE
jgi:ABC-2 type transport system ATP-binding protein